MTVLSSPAGALAGGLRPVALVTGAARRIGRSIALEMAAHGHDIALHVREPGDDAERTSTDLRALGARVVVLVADLADEAACAVLLDRRGGGHGPG